MPMDGAMVHALVSEMKTRIIDGRMDKIYQINATDLLLKMRVQNSNQNLYLSSHATKGGLFLTDHPPTGPANPPLFTMVLRKHLSGAKLREISQQGLDRTVSFVFQATDEIGDPTRRTLVVEIMGKHSNIILVDTDTGVIIDALKKFNHLVSRHREVLPGRTYVLPPGQDQKNLLDLPLDHLSALLMEQETDLPTALARLFQGISRKTFQYLLRTRDMDQLQVVEMGELEYNQLTELLSSFRTSLSNRQFQPTMEQSVQGAKDGFLFPSPAIVQPIYFDSVNGMLSSMSQQRKLLDNFNQEQKKLTKQVRGWIKKLEKKRAIHESNLQKAEEARTSQLYGELLTAHLHLLKAGMKEVTLKNYYDPNMAEITIPLDPALGPSANASRFFKRVSKVREAAKISRIMIKRIHSDLAYLYTVEEALERADAIADLDEILEELVKTGFLSKPKEKKKKSGDRTAQPLKFRSTSGLQILVGKNNRQNDLLTMKQAEPEDIWFHTKDIPGAHVILKTAGHPPDETALLEAAILAASFSKGKTSIKVPVDYTTRKHLRKPKGAKPGMVIYDSYKSLLVDPDPSLVEKLRVPDSK